MIVFMQYALYIVKNVELNEECFEYYLGLIVFVVYHFTFFEVMFKIELNYLYHIVSY